jgi:hypothetical protein
VLGSVVIYVPYVWHVSLIELLWLLGGVVGLVISAINVNDSWRDRVVVRSLKRDPSIHTAHWEMVELAAHGRLSSQWTRARICVYITAVGLYACVTPNPAGGAITVTGLLVTVALVGISLETAVRSYRDYRQSEQLYDLAQGRSAVLGAKMRIEAEAMGKESKNR